MIKYIRLCDGKTYSSWEDCERDNTPSLKVSKIESEAIDLFGEMRDSTLEEQKHVSEYIESISTKLESKHKKVKQLFKLKGE